VFSSCACKLIRLFFTSFQRNIGKKVYESREEWGGEYKSTAVGKKGALRIFLKRGGEADKKKLTKAIEASTKEFL